MAESEKPEPEELARLPELKRLGKNLNGYLGKTIKIGALLEDCVSAAQAHGWTVEEMLAAPKRMLGLTRRAFSAADGGRRIGSPAPCVYISTGIHGDEPAGPLAVRRLLQDNKWPSGVNFWLCPCLNPAGFLLNRRENEEGLDLNRQYLHPRAPETLTHIAWLQRQPSFDLCLCLHEDWESHGFYVYELNPDNRPSLAKAIVSAVSKVCPVDVSETIEGRPARNGVIRPRVDPRSRAEWPESFFLLMHKTRLSYTLEAPSDFPLWARVAALTAGVYAALETFLAARPAA